MTINLASRFLEIVDAVYRVESLTARMDAMTRDIDFADGNAVRVMRLSAVGLGNYSRATGYPRGDISASWTTMTLSIERGRSFVLDRMDNEETLGLVLGSLIREWMRVHVAPELDAYRFRQLFAATSGFNRVATPTTLATAAAVLAAFDVGMNELDADEVPAEGRILYLSTGAYNLLKAALTRSFASEGVVDRSLQVLDKVSVVPVPQARFFTDITLNPGATASAGGFVKTAVTGRDLNFLIVHPSAVVQPVKLNQVKYFEPDVNQQSDGHLWQYRLYHDCFVYEEKRNGIYAHHSSA